MSAVGLNMDQNFYNCYEVSVSRDNYGPLRYRLRNAEKSEVKHKVRTRIHQ